MSFSDDFHRFVWTVYDFNLADPDVVLESQCFRTFYILDAEFRLLLTPRADAVSLELQRKGDDMGPAKLKVKFELGLVDSLGVDRKVQVLTHEFARNTKCGNETFLARSKVLDFLQRGTLTIYCNVHAEKFSKTTHVDFDYKVGVEELVVEEKLVVNMKSDRRLESKSFPPGFVVKFRRQSEVLKILVIPIQTPKADMEVFAEIMVAEKPLSSHSQKFAKDVVTSLVFPDVKTSDMKKDAFKLRVTVMDLKPVVTTKNHEATSSKSKEPSFENTKPDLFLKARGGSFYCSSLPFIAHSPVLYRALKKDDWLHFGLLGRIDDPPKVEQVKEVDMKVTRQPGYTTVELPNLSKSALEIVYKYLNGGENLQMQKEDVEDVYQVGKVLEIPLVGDICVAEYLKKNMTTDAVFDRLKFGSSLSDEDHKDILTSICLDHIHRHMGEILTSEDWRNFLAKDKDLAEIVLSYLQESEGQREII